MDETLRLAETTGDVQRVQAEKARAGLPGGRTYLRGHESAGSAYVQDGYPYGRRGRCLRRVWIEYKPKNGFRFVYQTSQPYYPESGETAENVSVRDEDGKVRAGRWNKPKASTYSVAEVLYLDAENGHIETDVLGSWNPLSDAETNPESDIDAFLARAAFAITPEIESAVKTLRLMRRVGRRITYTVTAGPSEPIDLFGDPLAREKLAALTAEQEERKKEENALIRALVVDEAKKMNGAAGSEKLAEHFPPK